MGGWVGSKGKGRSSTTLDSTTIYGGTRVNNTTLNSPTTIMAARERAVEATLLIHTLDRQYNKHARTCISGAHSVIVRAKDGYE